MRSSTSARAASSRRSQATVLGRKISWRKPTDTGVDDHDSYAAGPRTFRRASAEETNRSPPVIGSFCDSVSVRDAAVCSCGTNSVLPSSRRTGMIDLL